MTMDVGVSERNPRYLRVDGEIVFLVGATDEGGWRPISDPSVDYESELDRLAGVIDAIDSPHVRGLCRVIPYFPGHALQPWTYRSDDGAYDLGTFDPDWEARLRNYLRAASDRGIVVALELWEDWSITRGQGGSWNPGPEQAWNAHPFNPENNVNFGEDVLSATTAACDAPFYSTVPETDATEPALDLQRRYADHFATIASEFSNVVFTLSNESRATLEWSTYWNEYLRDALPSDRLIGDMPSVDDDGRGQCDPDLSPATLFADDRYDFVDCAQALTTHAFGDDVHDLVTGTDRRVREYAAGMKAAGTTKPILITKDYSNQEPDGRPVIWSKFLAGTASVRFHRPMVDMWDQAEDTATFCYESIEHLGTFAAETPFWRLGPAPDLVHERPAGSSTIARSNPGECYVIMTVDGTGGELVLDVAPGTYEGRWFDAGSGKFSAVEGVASGSEATESGRLQIGADEQFGRPVPDGAETQLLQLRAIE